MVRIVCDEEQAKLILKGLAMLMGRKDLDHDDVDVARTKVYEAVYHPKLARVVEIRRVS